MAKGIIALLRDLVQLYQYDEVSVILDAGASIGIPETGFVFPDKEGKSFFVKATKACNVVIEGKASASDETWYTKNKVDADGVITWALVANEGAWIHTKAPARLVRLFVTDTSSTVNIITVTGVGGR